MISKWFEVSVDLFNIIFDTYWKIKNLGHMIIL